MGQGSDGDEVGPGCGVGRDRVDGDAAGDLDGDAAADEGDGGGDRVGVHVVEEDQVGAGVERRPDLLHGVALDLAGHPGPPGAGGGDGVGDGEAGQVVVLDQDAVGERAP